MDTLIDHFLGNGPDMRPEDKEMIRGGGENDGRCCPARCDLVLVPYYCTRIAGHDGPHEASGTDCKIIARWS